MSCSLNSFTGGYIGDQMSTYIYTHTHIYIYIGFWVYDAIGGFIYKDSASYTLNSFKRGFYKGLYRLLGFASKLPKGYEIGDYSGFRV